MDNQARILVVDDTPANLAAIEALLSPLGHQVDVAYSSHEGLLMARAADYTLILLDVRMPIMTGPEMAGILRKEERTRKTPILFMSAYEGTPAMVADSPKSAGPMDFLFNLDPDVLRAKVAGWVELRLEIAGLTKRVEELTQENEELRTKLQNFIR